MAANQDLNVKGDLSYYGTTIRVAFTKMRVGFPYIVKYLKIFFMSGVEILEYHHLRTLILILFACSFLLFILFFFVQDWLFINDYVFLAKLMLFAPLLCFIGTYFLCMFLSFPPGWSKKYDNLINDNFYEMYKALEKVK